VKLVSKGCRRNCQRVARGGVLENQGPKWKLRAFRKRSSDKDALLRVTKVHKPNHYVVSENFEVSRS